HPPPRPAPPPPPDPRRHLALRGGRPGQQPRAGAAAGQQRFPGLLERLHRRVRDPEGRRGLTISSIALSAYGDGGVRPPSPVVQSYFSTISAIRVSFSAISASVFTAFCRPSTRVAPASVQRFMRLRWGGW